MALLTGWLLAGFAMPSQYRVWLIQLEFGLDEAMLRQRSKRGPKRFLAAVSDNDIGFEISPIVDLPE
ncbi:MAG: hypothetical protein ACLPPV_14625 [Candidatus Korobacteraceae bacterium]|jgi:hypothetical protein